jgi:hypothetical protein
MGACDYCGTTILFGGRQAGARRFCNESCESKGVLLKIADQLPRTSSGSSRWWRAGGAFPGGSS